MLGAVRSEYGTTREAVGQTLIRTPAGGTATLSQVAHVRVVEGPEAGSREHAEEKLRANLVIALERAWGGTAKFAT